MPDTRGRGAESTVRIGDGTRDAKSLPKELREIGEPCARKPARTVWRGEVEKGLAEIPLEGISGRSKASHSCIKTQMLEMVTMFRERNSQK